MSMRSKLEEIAVPCKLFPEWPNPRLIDANALIEKAYWHGERPDVGNPFAEGVEAVDVNDIDEAPTIEAEPVRHGEWIDRYGGKYANHLWECSECKEKALWRFEVDALGKEIVVQDLSDFCPGCGAKMDGNRVESHTVRTEV